MPPLLSAGLRFFVAGAILLALVAGWRQFTGGPPIREALRGRVSRLCLLGLLHFLAANGLISVAVQDLPSSSAAVLFSTVPLWSLLLTSAMGRVRPAAADLARTLVGLAGVAIVLGYHAANVLPSVLVLGAALTWAGATLLASRDPVLGGPARARAGAGLESSIQMIAGGLGLIVAAGVAGEWGAFDPHGVEPEAWAALVYLIVLGSLAGFLAYTWLVISHVDARLTSTFSYVTPLVAVALGVVVLDEHLGINTLVGAALVALSVALTVRAAIRAGGPTPSRRSPEVDEQPVRRLPV